MDRVDVDTVIRDCVEVFKRTRKDIDVQTDLLSRGWSVIIDRSEMGQTLGSLLIQAYYGMPKCLRLMIQSRCVHLTEDHVQPHRLSTGPYIKISVAHPDAGTLDRNSKGITDFFHATEALTTEALTTEADLRLATVCGTISRNHGFVDTFGHLDGKYAVTIHLPAINGHGRVDAPHPIHRWR